MRTLSIVTLSLMVLLGGCSSKVKTANPGTAVPAPVYFNVDAATAGSVTGTIHFAGKRPAVGPAIDMSNEPACVEAHHGKAHDESLMVSGKGDVGDVANAFVYVKSGLEGKTFAVPSTPVVIDQRGCWFHPRVMGIQVGQMLQVVNSDPVTHNIHPMAQVNRDWNHSQGAGDPPLARKFVKPEIMIPVKCNIHSWMHAWIGAVDSPYFAVSDENGTFSITNIPPGTYTLAVWQEKLGTQERTITVDAQARVTANFMFSGR
jgi:plastocyanin